MIAMQSVLKHGRRLWDRTLLAEDEYEERVRITRRLLEEADLDALACFGVAWHYGNLSYLTGNLPMAWQAVAIGREGDPVLVTLEGPEIVTFIRTQTWIRDIRPVPNVFMGPAQPVSDALAAVAGSGARVVLVGAREEVPAAGYDSVIEALSGYDVREDVDFLASLREVKRPRELTAISRATEIARAAVAAGAAAREGGASVTEALVAADREARMLGAGETHVLGARDGRHLVPIEDIGGDSPARFVVYLEAEYLGYWGQACYHDGPNGAAERALQAMLDASGPGVAASDVARAATAELPDGEGDVALSYGLGGGIGLDTQERPRLTPDSGDRLVPGAVLGICVFTIENDLLGCAGQMIRVGQSGVAVL